MRKACALVVASATLAFIGDARAQVTDAQRAAARDLFRQGDELQRGSRFAEALDRFGRAQEVFSAPTNLLRIAECDAALGRLVESAEAYRAVLRTPLGAGASSAFVAAVDQARAELEQVAPRVPKLVVQVQPASESGSVQLQIDGQTVPAALLGEPMPLDPGMHRVRVGGAGLAGSEQTVELHEQDTRTVTLAVRPSPGAPAAASEPGSTAGAAPNPTAPEPSPLQPSRSNVSLLVGLHLGIEVPTGKLPAAAGATGPVDVGTLGAGGLAYGVDGGLRFARHFIVGVTLERASLAEASTSKLEGVSRASANTTLVAVTLGLVVTPERPTFYGELGVGARWYGYSENGTSEPGYATGELALGAGVWLPVAKNWRIVPKVTGGFGSFSPPPSASSASSQPFGFFTVGVAGFYSADL